jgi:hypothetical protein
VTKHREEVQRMSKLYREKLQREAEGKALKRKEDLERAQVEEKARKERAKRNLEREQRLEEAASVWVKAILPVWEKQKGGHNSGPPAKAKEYVWKVGIPPRVRAKVWPLAVANALMITPELFTIFGAHAKKARDGRDKYVDGPHAHGCITPPHPPSH